MLDPATDVDLVAGAKVSGCQYFSCQCLWLPVSVANVSAAGVLQLPVPLLQLLVPLHQLPMSRLLVPKLPVLLRRLPVPLPRLPVSAGALAGVHVLCHGCQGYHQASC